MTDLGSSGLVVGGTGMLAAATRSRARQQIGISEWHPDPEAEDGKRWLSDPEISGGAIAMLQDPRVSRLIIGTCAGP